MRRFLLLIESRVIVGGARGHSGELTVIRVYTPPTNVHEPTVDGPINDTSLMASQRRPGVGWAVRAQLGMQAAIEGAVLTSTIHHLIFYGSSTASVWPI